MLNFIQSVSSNVAAIFGHDVVGVAGIFSTTNEILTFAVQKLPDGGRLPDGVHEAAIYFGNTLGKVNFILPVDVLVSCLVIIISLKITMFGFHVLMWIYSLIRGFSISKFDGAMVPGGYVSGADQSRRFMG